MARKKVKKGEWLKEEIQYLKKNFPSNATADVAKALGRGLDPVKKKASRMGLKKTKKYLKTLGRA